MMVKGKNGRTYLIPSPQYSAWHKEQSYMIAKHRPQKPTEMCIIHIYFYAPDNRKTDLTNKAESIMDLLVDNRILKDDNWGVVHQLHLIFIKVDKENPRAEISIII